jgi:hypothetical protein
MTVKTKVKLHPLLDLSGVDQRDVEHLLAGRPFVALRRIKRDGQVYERGDRIVLGALEFDGSLLRENPFDAGRTVMRPEAFEFAKLDKQRRNYERETLEPLRRQYDNFKADLQATRLLRASLQAKLGGVESELNSLQQAVNLAQKKLDAALKDAP